MGTLYYNDESIQFTGIIRVTYSNNKYGLSIENMTDENQNKFYSLIYDGQNMSLPWKQDAWMTIYDALLINMIYHLKNSWHRISTKRNG
jgi:cellulose synthase (UDP-forming)